MSRARDLSKLGNINVLSADTTDTEVGIASTVPSSTLDVRGELRIGTAIQAGVAGVLTATSFSGSGSNLTGLATTETVRTDTLTVAGVSTLTGVTNVTGAANFASAVNVDATTDSTSATTGALIVDGGLGVAKNVYIGAGLSVAGTLTYEDVTSVDSVGLITAKSGVNVSGGQVTIGTGITMGIAGVATFSGTSDVHLLDSVQLNLGDASDLTIKHDGSNSRITNGTGALYLEGGGGNIQIRPVTAEQSITAYANGAVALFHDNSQKFETTNDGTVTTGIATVTQNTGNVCIDSHATGSGRGSQIKLQNDHGVAYVGTAGDTSGNLLIHNESDSVIKIATNNTEKLEVNKAGTVTTGISTVDGLRLGDNEYISVGAGGTGDLQLSHNGSHSYINHTGTGDLWIRNTQTNGDIYIVPKDSGAFVVQNTANEVMIDGSSNGAVSLYYNNSKKFETTNDGTVTTGICTATDFSGASGGSADFPNGLSLADNKKILVGSSDDLEIYHSGSDNFITADTQNLILKTTAANKGTYIQSDDHVWITTPASAEVMAKFIKDGAVELNFNDSKKFETTNDGSVITGITTFSKGCDFNGILREKHNQVDAKLSADVNINLENGMLHYYSVNETTTAAPNIRYNASKTLNNMMTIGETVTVTIIYKPNGAGYYADLNVDGNGVTEEWNGGSAPSSANAGGYDILTHTLFKVANQSFLCFSNVQNYA